MRMEFRGSSHRPTRITISRDDYYYNYPTMEGYLGTWCEEVLNRITKKKHSQSWYDSKVDHMLDVIISRFIHVACHETQDDEFVIVKRYNTLYFQYSEGEVWIIKFHNV